MNTSEVCVLILDDDENVRMNLVAFFEDEGFNVISSPTAENAFDIMAAKKIEIGIIDIRLPGMDGNRFILKAHELQPRLDQVL